MRFREMMHKTTTETRDRYMENRAYGADEPTPQERDAVEINYAPRVCVCVCMRVCCRCARVSIMTEMIINSVRHARPGGHYNIIICEI